MRDQSETERPILRFYIATSYDARSHVEYRYAPTDWADMTEEEREKFLREESEEWAGELLEIGAHVYDPAAERYIEWETGGSPDEPEEIYD